MKGKELADRILTLVIALCAVTVTVLLVHRELSRPHDPNAPLPLREVKNWQEYVAGDERIGPEHAPVTIIEFSDFQCPFCGQLFRSLNDMRARRPLDFAIVYRNFPLQAIHPQARPAAIAAECAAGVGHFSEYHDFLFQHQDSLGVIPWTTIAQRVGVQDTLQFSRCLSSGEVVTKLRQDSTAGMKLKLAGTPAVMINGWMFTGAMPAARLDSLVSSEIKHARSM